MSIQGLTIDTDVETGNQDTIGGGGFIKDTGLYPMLVDMAYLGKSAKGAMSLNMHFRVVNGDARLVRQTIYITSGDTKGNKNYYINSKTKKKHLLPGAALADQISRVLTGLPMAGLTPETKTIKLWDFASQAEKPTEVAAITEMIGKQIAVGLVKCRTNKAQLNDQTGKYEDTNDVRELNEISKVFYPDGFSVAERAAEADAPEFKETWLKRFTPDFVEDTYKAVEVAPDADALPSSEATSSLFA